MRLFFNIIQKLGAIYLLASSFSYAGEPIKYQSPCVAVSTLLGKAGNLAFVPKMEQLNLLSRGFGRPLKPSDVAHDLGLSDVEGAFNQVYRKSFNTHWQSAFLIHTGGKTTPKQKTTFQQQIKNLESLLADEKKLHDFIAEWVAIIIETRSFHSAIERTRLRLIAKAAQALPTDNLIYKYFHDTLKNTLASHQKALQNTTLKGLRVQKVRTSSVLGHGDIFIKALASIASGSVLSLGVKEILEALAYEHSHALLSESALLYIFILSSLAMYKIPSWEALDLEMAKIKGAKSDHAASILHISDLSLNEKGVVPIKKTTVDFYSQTSTSKEIIPYAQEERAIPIYIWWNGIKLFDTSGSDITDSLSNPYTRPSQLLLNKNNNSWFSEYNFQNQYTLQMLFDFKEVESSPILREANLWSENEILYLKKALDELIKKRNDPQNLSSGLIFFALREWSELSALEVRMKLLQSRLSPDWTADTALLQLTQWQNRVDQLSAAKVVTPVDLAESLDQGLILLGKLKPIFKKLRDAINQLSESIENIDYIDRSLTKLLEEAHQRHQMLQVDGETEDRLNLERSLDQYEFLTNLIRSHRVTALRDAYKKYRPVLESFSNQKSNNSVDYNGSEVVQLIENMKMEFDGDALEADRLQLKLKALSKEIKIYRHRLIMGAQ